MISERKKSLCGNNSLIILSIYFTLFWNAWMNVDGKINAKLLLRLHDSSVLERNSNISPEFYSGKKLISTLTIPGAILSYIHSFI